MQFELHGNADFEQEMTSFVERVDRDFKAKTAFCFFSPFVW